MLIAKNATITCGDMKLTGLTVKSVRVDAAAEIAPEPIGFAGSSNTLSGTITVTFRLPKIRRTKGRQVRLVRVWHG